MKVKVCGIREKGNLDFLNSSEVDMIGLIFYDKSKRFFDNGNVSIAEVTKVDKTKVGVFVNATMDEVLEKVRLYGLDIVQLHGDESPEYCMDLKTSNILIAKAFSVSDKIPENVKDYVYGVDYFLFDTKGVDYGGNGFKFDWSVLEDYNLNIPFIVSGGIGPEDIEKLRDIKNSKMIGVDVNSGFEIEPGLKDEALLKRFIKSYKTE